MFSAHPRRFPPRRSGSSRIKTLQYSILLGVFLFVVLVMYKLDDIAEEAPLADDSLGAHMQRASPKSMQEDSSTKDVQATNLDQTLHSRQADPATKLTEPADATKAPVFTSFLQFGRQSGSSATEQLEAILAKYRVPTSLPTPADYGNAQYDAEAERLIQGIPLRTTDPVEMSLLLMARRGHRTRVSHLIGGYHLDPQGHRDRIQTMAKVFAPFSEHVQAVDGRDFSTDPVHYGVGCSQPVPCTPGSPDASAYMMSMENVQCSNVNQPKLYCGNPQLSSDIPLPYISWHDFGVLKQVDSKNRPRLAAAYISNCGFGKRNDMVKRLVDITKHKVQSYGHCVNSGDPEPHSAAAGPGGKKLEVLESFKFSLSFENSETEDYVTEKFFGALCSGAVPVVIGAPNIKFWAPDTTTYPYRSNALLYSGDFGDSAERIANVMIELDQNQEAYEEMLRWKRTGYSDDYKALVDLGDVHSHCRGCVIAADDLRYAKGPNAYDVRTLKDFVIHTVHQFHLFVRERGTYSFTRLGFINQPSMRELVQATLKNIPLRPKNLYINNQDLRNKPTRTYAFYLPRPARAAVLTDADLAVVPNGCELEVILI